MAQLAEDWRRLDLPPKERAMLEYAEAVSLSASTMTAAYIEGLREVGWNDPEILDITLVIGYYNVMSRIADTFGVELDKGVVDEGLVAELDRRGVTPAH